MGSGASKAAAEAQRQNRETRQAALRDLQVQLDAQKVRGADLEDEIRGVESALSGRLLDFQEEADERVAGLRLIGASVRKHIHGPTDHEVNAATTIQRISRGTRQRQRYRADRQQDRLHEEESARCAVAASERIQAAARCARGQQFARIASHSHSLLPPRVRRRPVPVDTVSHGL